MSPKTHQSAYQLAWNKLTEIVLNQSSFWRIVSKQFFLYIHTETSSFSFSCFPISLFFFFLFSYSFVVVCAVYSETVENDQSPHIVLDTTMTPVISEISKSFTSVLALPTISGSFGQEGDIRQWRDINEHQGRYLLQVMPPSDIIPEVIRSIIVYMNMSNAAILFDKSFGKWHIRSK